MKPWATIKRELEIQFDNKKILILGFGKEGMSTYQLLKRLDIDLNLTIMDQNFDNVKSFLADCGDRKTLVTSDSMYLKSLEIYDVLFKTPGLPSFLLEGVDIDKITSQSQLFMTYLSDRTIGVTGTKGKSTTSSIIKHVLEGAGLHVKLIGNIGVPSLEALVDDDGMTYYVCEMSSFQTEYLHIGPRYRVILNLFQEHLNNYKGYDEYQESKLQLFRAATKTNDKNMCIFGCDNSTLVEKMKTLRGIEHPNKAFLSFGYLENNSLEDDGYFIQDEWIVKKQGTVIQPIISTHFSRKLLGEHNLINALVTFIIVDELNAEGVIQLSTQRLIELIGQFKGLRHRLEDIGTFNGITFYNDSISTIPEATMKAVEAISSISTLIIGGFDRTIDYQAFAKYLNKLQDTQPMSIICLPTTGHKIATLMGNPAYCHYVETMQEAVQLSYSITPVGKGCLLSPAASSFNQYKNFEDRGEHFTECVKEFGRA